MFLLPKKTDTHAGKPPLHPAARAALPDAAKAAINRVLSSTTTTAKPKLKAKAKASSPKKQSTAADKKKPPAKKGKKKGGDPLNNLAGDLSTLAVPFGLILAKKSLEYMQNQKPAQKKSVGSQRRRVAGGGCGSCQSYS
jgi:hypothetical protein